MVTERALEGVLEESAPTRAKEAYGRRLRQLGRMEVPALDGRGTRRLDSMDVLEDRHDATSMIITRQLPVAMWHPTMGDRTITDASLDRAVHESRKIGLRRKSMGKI